MQPSCKIQPSCKLQPNYYNQVISCNQALSCNRTLTYTKSLNLNQLKLQPNYYNQVVVIATNAQVVTKLQATSKKLILTSCRKAHTNELWKNLFWQVVESSLQWLYRKIHSNELQQIVLMCQWACYST